MDFSQKLIREIDLFDFMSFFYLDFFKYSGALSLIKNFYSYRDPQFNLNDFLRSLRVELKSWRKVFWRLWGMCHSLYCSLCSSYFPVYMHEFCSFHPQDPDFPGIQFKTSQQPYGAFSCCQMAVYRFQPLSANQKVAF